MGLLDYPAPLFQFVDGLLGFLPPFLRLTLWSAVAGMLSMLLYGFVSPQKRIAQVKVQLREAQRALAASDESFADLLGEVGKTLGLSFKHLGLVFGPALVSALPLICIIAWASTQFGHKFPQPGAQSVTVSVEPAGMAGELHWRTPADGEPGRDDSAWELAWPADPRQLTLVEADAGALLDIPPPAAIPVIHKRQWWNSLLGNPAGYLPPQSSVEVVNIELPPQRFIPFGPDWVASWLTLFLVVSVVGALATKRAFRIH
ncbi:MAG: hypothetical protein U5K56_13595 [Halioglobus sp.]|nr:hypothetical protein [Halioglobus sp.]